MCACELVHSVTRVDTSISKTTVVGETNKLLYYHQGTRRLYARCLQRQEGNATKKKKGARSLA